MTSRQSFDSSSALSKSFCCWCLLDPWQDVFRLPTTLSHVWVNLLLVTLLRFDLCYGISKLARRFDEINQKIVVSTFKLVSPLIPSFLVFSSRQYKSKLMRKIMHLVFGLDLNSVSWMSVSSMWPDWTIFKLLVNKCTYKSSPYILVNFWACAIVTTFLYKWCGYFLGNIGNNWATFFPSFLRCLQNCCYFLFMIYISDKRK